MIIALLLFCVKSFDSFKLNLLRGYQIEVNNRSPRMKTKSNEDSWYFVHFNAKPDYSLLSKKGIVIKTSNMINKLWYSLFLTPTQADFISKFASLKAVTSKEKFANPDLIEFSEALQVETSSSFDLSKDLKSFGKEKPLIHKLTENLYQISGNNNKELAQILASNNKVYLITPKNKTQYFNNRAAGYTQLNTQKAQLSGRSGDVITIDRPLQAKGLDGEGQVILVQDTYLDPNSTFFYDPNHPTFEKNHYYDDHRKLRVIFDEYDYKTPRANEHGTHVAGCAAGASHLPLSESDMALYDGVAPKAKISFYQSGSSGMYNSQQVKKIVDNTHPSVCTNSWGFRQQSMSDDNQWNTNAKEMNNTLFMFAGGNFGAVSNPILDYYENLNSPGTGKNLLTVGATTSIPINEEEDGKVVIDYTHKNIYLFQTTLQQTYFPKVKAWSLKPGNLEQSADYLFTKGSIDATLTYNQNDNIAKNKKILIINGIEGFNSIDKQNPPLIALSSVDFDVDDFETRGFANLFPVLILDNHSITELYSNYRHSVVVETNYVSSKLTNITRVSFSSRGLSNIGLMKPEIVSPGTAMFSARSDPEGGFGHADIAIMDGTSMATPNVAGAAALVAQYFTTKKYRSSLSIIPSGTLLRSILINAADPLDINLPYPNADVGYGVLNLGKYILTGNSRDGDDEYVLVGDHIKVVGDQHLVTEIEVKDTNRDLRITISYLDEVLNTDSSAALVIDLDLVVIEPDGTTVYRGNQRVDDTEEMFSTNERVLIAKDKLKTGKYEIHIISHIPEIVPSRSAEFSISVFGSISYSKGNTISFENAKTCIPIVEKHGACNEETKLNECNMDDFEGYTGHSCQSEVGILVEDSKALFELEPYGTKYVNVFYPLDACFSNLTITIASATPFFPKYAYTLNSTGLKYPMRELDADNIQMNNDISITILNHGQAEAWQIQSAFFSLVYNKSPKKTTFIAGYQIHQSDYIDDDVTPVKPTESGDSVVTKSITEYSYLIPFIIVIVACAVLFICVVILAVHIRRTNNMNDHEFKSEGIKTSLF